MNWISAIKINSTPNDLFSAAYFALPYFIKKNEDVNPNKKVNKDTSELKHMIG